ncbi:MAG: hypothetical protein KA140_02525 [Caldisericia bacterium]|nr:hypothetical protein [Caldisericia bacterium]
MNTFDVLKRRGVKINFAVVLLAVVAVVIVILLFSCRTDQSNNTSQNNSKSVVSQAEKKPLDAKPNKNNDNTFDDHAGSSKLFKNYKFVGNSDTMVYHVTDGSCPAADKMNPDNIVKLNSKEDARKKGYSRCDICKP